MPTPVPTISISQRPRTGGPVMALPSKASSIAKPLVWLGAKSPGGLALPCAQPTPSQMYAPRGVWMDDEHFIVCDSGNHRILIWNGTPTEDGQPADIVLGQANFYSEGPAGGQANFENGFHLPTGVIVVHGKLLVADAWHHRVLVWNEVPTKSQTPPDYAIGQHDLVQVQPNRGEQASANSMYWPYGLGFIEGKLYVTDTGNRRVLIWTGIPQANQAADWVLGQPDTVSTGENRDGPVSENSFRWPHAVAGSAHQLWIADAGNHRVLGWWCCNI